MRVVQPESKGFSSDRLKHIDKLMQDHVDAGRLPGVVTLVARHGQVVQCECYGMRDIESQTPMQVDTIFRLASMDKPITSAAVMMLYEEGRFQLYEPVANYIPDFQNLKVYSDGDGRDELERPITIHHLLTHTAGLSVGFRSSTTPVEKMYFEKLSDETQPVSSLEDVIKKLAELPLAFQPGSEWRYSMAHVVLAYLIEVISGVPYDQFIREKILQPLGMIDTGFYVPEEKLNRLATLYGPGPTVYATPENSGLDKLPEIPLGMVSTVPDYLRFCQMMLNGGQLDGVRLLGRKTVEFMTMNHLDPAQMPMRFPVIFLAGYGWGLGLGVLVDVAASHGMGTAGEYGWIGAFRTYFWVDPTEGIIGIAMSQLVGDLPEIPRNYYQYLKAMKSLVYQALVD